jgi:membrane-associated protease RseP (regulator of RpoE activity)
MSQWVGIGLFALAVLLVVMVHESGHFFTAKAFGIKVEEFFVGFGPRLWSFRRGETEYGIKALPFGGYVRIAGMNPFQEPSPEEYPRTYGAKPAWQRAAVIGAGPVTHFVMAILFLAVFFTAIGVPSRFVSTIDGVETTLNGKPSPAAVAGLRLGDVIVAVDGIPVRPTDDPAHTGDDFRDYTRSHVGQAIQVTVRRGDRTLTVGATPVLAEVDGEQVGRLGILLGQQSTARDRTNPLTAVGRGAIQTGQTMKFVVLQLGHVFGPGAFKRLGQLLFGPAERQPTDPTSIIGAGQLAGKAVKAGAWDFLFYLLVVFNVFVGILNLVPLPPLDGGHLAVLAYEKVRGRKPDPRKLIPLTTAVAGFIVLYAVAVSYLDIVKPIPSPFR